MKKLAFLFALALMASVANAEDEEGLTPLEIESSPSVITPQTTETPPRKEYTREEMKELYAKGQVRKEERFKKLMVERYKVPFTETNYVQRRSCVKEVIQLEIALRNSYGSKGQFTSRSFQLDSQLKDKLDYCRSIN